MGAAAVRSIYELRCGVVFIQSLLVGLVLGGCYCQQWKPAIPFHKSDSLAATGESRFSLFNWMANLPSSTVVCGLYESEKLKQIEHRMVGEPIMGISSINYSLSLGLKGVCLGKCTEKLIKFRIFINQI